MFIFAYFICHIRHKLNVTYVTKLDAVIFFVLCSLLRKTINHPNLHQFNAFISNLYKVLSEKILVTLTFLKKVNSLMYVTLF